MAEKFFFVSKDSNWQVYRNEVLSKLADTYKVDIEILTTDKLKDYIKNKNRLQYIIFKNYFKPSSKISFFPGAIRYIIKHKPDAVFALNNTTQLTEYLAFFICKLYRIKFIWWTHGYDHLPLKNKFLRNLRKKYTLFFLKRANVIIAFSMYGKEYLINHKIPEHKILVASNTLDTEEIIAHKKIIEEAFDKHSFLQKKFPLADTTRKNIVLLFSGRLLKNKKVDNAIKTLALLSQEKDIVVTLLIVGDGPEKQSLIDLVAELHLQDKVYFAGAVFDDDEVTEYFLASDIFLMPGYVGLAIVHAFSFGLPIITEKLDIHPPEIHYLKPGINGFFIEEDDIKTAADLIKQISLDNTKYLALQKGAIETALNEANIYNMLRNMYLALTKNNN